MLHSSQFDRFAAGSCLLGGIALGISFPPIGFWPLSWAAPVPLLVSAARLGRRRTFLHGLLFFVPGLGIPYHWVALHRFWVPGAVSAVALFAIMCTAAAVVAGAGGLFKYAPPRRRVLGIATVYLAFELALLYGPVPFPAALVGYSQADAVWSDPILRLVGLPGLSAAVFGVSVAGAGLLVRRVNPISRMLSVTGGIVAAAFVVGWISGPLPTPEKDPAPDGSSNVIRVSLIQPALEPDIWADVYSQDRLLRLETRIRGLLAIQRAEMTDSPSSTTIHILPETSVPETAFRDSTLPASSPNTARPDSVEPDPSQNTSAGVWLRELASTIGAPVLSGAILPADGPGQYTNSVLFADSSGVRGRYDKQIMVPFAERVPFSNLLPELSTLNVPAGGVRSYMRGTRNAPIAMDQFTAGVMVCFESLFPQASRHQTVSGADVLVVVTQDGWWRTRFARRQHLVFSRMRAVETGLPLVQVSVDGESGAFDSRGRAIAIMPTRVPAAQTVRITPSESTTPYVRMGDWPLLVILLISTSVVLYPAAQRGLRTFYRNRVE